MTDYFHIALSQGELLNISSLGLAHIGDGVFELMVRSYLCTAGDHTVRNFHKDAINLVKAPAQAKFADKLLPHLTEDEAAYYRRGKNAHTHAHPKGATRQEYAKATGLETRFGALYLLGQTERMNQLFAICMEE